MARITWLFSSRYISALSFLDPDSLPHALRLVFEIDPPAGFAVFAFGETFLEAFLAAHLETFIFSRRVAAHSAGGDKGGQRDHCAGETENCVHTKALTS